MICDIFSFEHTLAYKIFESRSYPHEVIPEIKKFILKLGQNLPKEHFYSLKDGVWVAKTARIADTAFIGAPAIIDENAEIRHCAYIRECAIVGKNSVVGNSTELKNVILFDGVQVPHYNYVGDSVLGYKAHLGAGAITSNVKLDRSFITVDYGSGEINTALKKFGAILGDHVEVGCGAVLNPGTVIGRNTNVYPLSSVRGYISPDSIYRSATDRTVKLPYKIERGEL